jgi:hypothetical protein
VRIGEHVLSGELEGVGDGDDSIRRQLGVTRVGTEDEVREQLARRLDDREVGLLRRAAAASAIVSAIILPIASPITSAVHHKDLGLSRSSGFRDHRVGERLTSPSSPPASVNATMSPTSRRLIRPASTMSAPADGSAGLAASTVSSFSVSVLTRRAGVLFSVPHGQLRLIS